MYFLFIISGKEKEIKNPPPPSSDVDQTFSDDDTEVSDSEDDEWVPPTTARLDSDDSLDSESSDGTIDGTI